MSQDQKCDVTLMQRYRKCSFIMQKEFIRLTQLSNTFYTELKHELKDAIDQENASLYTFGLSLKSYDDCTNLPTAGRHVNFASNIRWEAMHIKEISDES
jgi:hypothetical protein